MDAPAHAYMTDGTGAFTRLSGCLVGRPLKGAREDGGYSETAAMMQYRIRSFFRLDALLLVRNVSNGLTGFIGLVSDNPDYANYKSHNLDRRDSGLRLTDGDTDYILLNDAGLNTLPLAASVDTVGENASVNPEQWVLFENYRKIRFTAAGSFYGVSQYRLYAKRITADDWYEVASGTVGEGSTLSLEWEGDIPSRPVVAGTDYYLSVRLEVTNAEGTVSDEKGPVLIRPSVKKITVYRTDSRNDPWNAGEEMEVYIGERDYNNVHVITESQQNTPAPVLPDGGRMWRLVGGSGFVELTDGQYNLWAFSGVVYSGGGIQYIYRPNSETEEPHWKVVIGIDIWKYGSEDGWPEAASSGYMYRIAVTARYAAVAGIDTPPPSAQVSGISVQAVSENGMPTGSLGFDRSSWDEGTVLALSDAVRSTASATYMYARDFPLMDKAYGVRVSAFDITPSDMDTEVETAPLP